MAIPETQLDTWSHQGSVKQSSDTYQTIRNALLASNTSYADKSYEVFLQGSYGNDTNIYAESDVDVVIRLDSIFRSNIGDLSPAEQQVYHSIFPKATYSLATFKAGVQAALVNRFGSAAVRPGNKAITIKGEGARRSADVIVCHQYRHYKKFDLNRPDDYTPGIIFPSEQGDVINYPKQHAQNLTAQHQKTSEMLKPMVRILKNMRSWMVENGTLGDGVAPSYYVEGLFFNVPATQYVSSSFGDTFCNGINWILKADKTSLVCANWRYCLLGESNVQWRPTSCDAFLAAACKLWKDW
ncbi:MAG: nucleotidyltransferase [Elusimicrobia bacterium]|nr:nucleotidyltransferase [Elusimicrobiota bacterium]